MPVTDSFANAEARARLAFRQMTNSLYLQQKVDAKPYLEGFLKSIEEEKVSDFFHFELCAQWYRLKPHYELLAAASEAKEIEAKLRAGSLRYLSLPH